MWKATWEPEENLVFFLQKSGIKVVKKIVIYLLQIINLLSAFALNLSRHMSVAKILVITRRRRSSVPTMMMKRMRRTM
jgi:hypothetical protein